MDLLTTAKKERQERDRKLYDDYLAMSAEPHAMKMAVMDNLQKKYKFHSLRAVYTAVAREKQRRGIA